LLAFSKGLIFRFYLVSSNLAANGLKIDNEEEKKLDNKAPNADAKPVNRSMPPHDPDQDRPASRRPGR